MKVTIYKPVKSAMQSGKEKSKKWLLTPIEEENSRQINPLMGWTSSDNTSTQIKIFFESKEEAIKYAENEGFEYEVKEEKPILVKKKSYSENFK